MSVPMSAIPANPRSLPAASLVGILPFGGAPRLSRPSNCPTWPQVFDHAGCEIAIDGYFVLDDQLYLGRTPAEQQEVGRLLTNDLPSFLRRVQNGCFNIVINDAAKRTTRIVNDQFGGMPLYLLHTPKQLVFSSTYAAIAAEANLSVDPIGVAEMYWFGFQLGNRTAYRGVEHMPFGSILTFDWDGATRTCSRWEDRSLETQTPPSTIAEMAEYVVGAMARATKRLHRTDAAYGAKISAGMDSRLICGSWPDSRLKTYTFGYAGASEVRIGKQLANALGMPNTFVPLEGDFFTPLNASTFPLFGMTDYYHHALLPAMQRDGVELALDGLVGDCFLGGNAIKATQSKWGQIFGVSPQERVMPSDEAMADFMLGHLCAPDTHYRPLTPEAIAQLTAAWEGIRADMAAEVAGARTRREGFTQIHEEVLYRNRFRRNIALQGAFCKPAVETLYPFLDREFQALFTRIPREWAASKRLYVEMYSRFLPKIRSVPTLMSLLPFTIPAKAHYLGRIVRYMLEMGGMKLSYATHGKLNPWPSNGIQWPRWLAFDKEFRAGAEGFMQTSSQFSKAAYDRDMREIHRGPKFTGKRFMLTASYCGYFR